MDIRRVGIKVSNSMSRACERLQVGAAVRFESREVLRNLGPRFRYVAVVEVIKRAVIWNIKINSINDRTRKEQPREVVLEFRNYPGRDTLNPADGFLDNGQVHLSNELWVETGPFPTEEEVETPPFCSALDCPDACR